MTAGRRSPDPGRRPASEQLSAPVAAKAASIDTIRAVLAILAYRIASYWLPLLAGPPAYLLFRHRYGRPVFRRATDERKAGSPT